MEVRWMNRWWIEEWMDTYTGELMADGQGEGREG